MGQSGVMNLGAFMDRLGGRMDDRRAALVDEAFDRLDTSGNGHLTLEEARCHIPLVSNSASPRISWALCSFVRLPFFIFALSVVVAPRSS